MTILSESLVRFITLALALSPFYAQERVSQATEPDLVLVLSGGGARGAAHIGVLRVLEEMHIVPDMIVGTSMGSIVGGLYASGWSPDEIHQLLLEIDWPGVFNDTIPRPDRTFRRKQDDRPFLITTQVHFDAKGVHLPPGLLSGQSLELLLASLEARTLPDADFDLFPIRYRAVASEITSGEIVVIDSGSLAAAMRASMAIPGMFAPVQKDGQILTDGGSVANLPIGVAKSLGARKVIAVDITSPLMSSRKHLEHFVGVFRQMNALLTTGNRRRDIALLDSGDVYIRPELGDLGFLDFERATEAVGIGERAARELADELKGFAKNEKTWAQFVAKHRAEPATSLAIDRLQLDNATVLDDRVVRTALDIETPVLLDAKQLNGRLLSLFNLRCSGVIRYRLEKSGGENDLHVNVPGPDHGPNTLRVGLSFFDDFNGETGYAVTLRHQYLPANRLGAEWENVAQIGSTLRLSSEFYQPLGKFTGWFTAPSVQYERGNQSIWVGGEPIAEYEVQRSGAQISLGSVLNNWGEVRLSAFFENLRGNPHIGIPGFPIEDFDSAGYRFSFRIDTEDAGQLPSSGTRAEATYSRSSPRLGSELDFARVFAALDQSWSIGKFVLAAHMEYGDNLKPSTSFFDLYFLGGPGRLSGLGADELFGHEVELASIGLRRRIKGIDLSNIRVRLFAGVSLEAGEISASEFGLDMGGRRYGGSAFLAAETPVGPVFLGYGVAGKGRNSFYFAIGDRF